PASLNPGVAQTAVPTVAVIPTPNATPGATLDPPRGARPAAAADPFTTPPPPPEPKTQSYLVEQYRWQPSDSFAGVSMRFYNTEKFAAALQQYNKDYPLAPPALRQNPPVLVPGQVVWVPPVRILERDYGQYVGELSPLTPAAPATPVV